MEYEYNYMQNKTKLITYQDLTHIISELKRHARLL